MIFNRRVRCDFHRETREIREKFLWAFFLVRVGRIVRVVRGSWF